MIGIIYNNDNKLKMENELSSLKFQMLENIELVHESEDFLKYEFLITDNSRHCLVNKTKSFLLIISSIRDSIFYLENVKMIQYESKNIKEFMEELYCNLTTIESVVINCIPNQKLEINPLVTQDNTIFFDGEDKPENMVDEMFELDSEVHYEIQFYRTINKEPSKLHKLSWNVTIDEDLKGIIQYKIIRELENGCLPILLKENAPSYFFAYPFLISLEELKDKSKLIARVKEMSKFIGKMTKDEYKMLANSIYNSVYIYSYWKLNFFKITEEIKRHCV